MNGFFFSRVIIDLTLLTKSYMGLGNTKMKEIRFLSYLQGVQRSWKMDMVNSI